MRVRACRVCVSGVWGGGGGELTVLFVTIIYLWPLENIALYFQETEEQVFL